MRLTFFVVWKSWASNPLRTLLSVLGVALGIAIVTAIHVVDHNTIESRLRLQRPNFGRVDLELAPLDTDRTPADVRTELVANEDIGAVGLLQQGYCVATAPSGRDVQVPLFGLSPLPSGAFSHYLVEEGADLSDLDGDRGVLVGAAFAETFGVEPGDRMELSRLQAQARTRCLDGVRVAVEGAEGYPPMTAAVEVRGVIAKSRLGARNDGFLLVASFALAAELSPSGRPLYQINRRPGVDVDRLRQDLAKRFEVLDDRSALVGEASDERAFRNGVKVLGCLALVMGMFVIFQTLSQSLVERLVQIGLLRALGTTRGTIAGVFLIDASATAFAGAVLGVAGGVGLAWTLQELGFTTLGRGKELVTFELPWGPLVWTAVIGVAFTLAGAAFPLFKARNLPALEVLAARGLGANGEPGETYVLRGVNLFLFTMLALVLPGAYLAMTPLLSEEGREAGIVLAQLGAMILVFGGVLLVTPRLVQGLGRVFLWPVRRLIPLPVFLVSKALQQSPGRFAASVCGIAVVLMAMLALESITYALRAEARQFGAAASNRRLFVKCDPVGMGVAERLRTLPGVENAELFYGRVDLRFALRGLGLRDLTRDGGLFENDVIAAERYTESRNLVVSERLAHLRHWRIGDQVTLVTDGGPVRYRVLAISDRAGFFPDERAWAIADPRWLQQDFCARVETVGWFSLGLEDDADPFAVLSEVREAIPRATWAKTGEELTAYALRDVGRDFFLFDVLLGLILLLAGLGLVNTMTIAALSRAREIGVLRALGVGKRGLWATFAIEGGIVAVLASALALILAGPLGWIVVEGLNRVAGLEAPFVVPWRAVAAVPVLAIATGLLAAVLPGLRALRESPAEAVRYE